MPLRKSPVLTPEMLAARQSSAQHSTGPRTEAGRLQSKMNAVQHGERSWPHHHTLVMLKLGEGPLEFEYLKKQLLFCYGLGEVLGGKQIDDTARLYWRRQRLERAWSFGPCPITPTPLPFFPGEGTGGEEAEGVRQ